jgi:primosomal protein N'
MKPKEAVYCKNCGHEKQFVECPRCEGHDYEDEDGDIVECPYCDDQGGNLICPQCHPEVFNL